MTTHELGADEAKLVGDAHEGKNADILQRQADNVAELRKEGRTVIKATIADSFVDQLNNQAGRKLAKSHPEATYLEFGNLVLQTMSGQDESTLYRFKKIPNSPNVLVIPAKIPLIAK